MGNRVWHDDGFAVETCLVEGRIDYIEHGWRLELNADLRLDRSVGFALNEDSEWKRPQKSQEVAAVDRARVVRNVKAALEFLGFKVAPESGVVSSRPGAFPIPPTPEL